MSSPTKRKKLSGNNAVRLTCILLMVGSAVVAVAGRGVISILQGILGVLFSIEGFWGAVEENLQTIKRFIKFLGAWIIISVFVGVVNFVTIDQYCSTAADTDNSNCQTSARLYSGILIASSGGPVPLAICVVIHFSRQIQNRDKGTLLDKPSKKKQTPLEQEIAKLQSLRSTA